MCPTTVIVQDRLKPCRGCVARSPKGLCPPRSVSHEGLCPTRGCISRGGLVVSRGGAVSHDGPRHEGPFAMCVPRGACPTRGCVPQGAMSHERPCLTRGRDPAAGASPRTVCCACMSQYGIVIWSRNGFAQTAVPQAKIVGASLCTRSLPTQLRSHSFLPHVMLVHPGKMQCIPQERGIRKAIYILRFVREGAAFL